MMSLGTQTLSPAGRYMIGGCDAVDLAAEFGTPLYVLDEAHLRARCREYADSLSARWPRSQVYFASKALPTTAVARIVVSEGLGLDVASGGELLTALAGGASPADLILHGNYKSAAELRVALEVGVGRICLDSMEEIEELERIAADLAVRPQVLIRANPNVKPKTHTSISTGQIDSKFGLSIQSGLAQQAVERVLAAEHLDLVGLHCHIGSQVLGWQAFAQAAAQMVDFMAQLRGDLGVVIEDLDLGGGLGIRYLPDHQPPAVPELVGHLVDAVEDRLAVHNYPAPRLSLEPGRSLVGEAGTTLYRVGPIKTIPHVRTYLSVDGGLSDNPRPEMYGAEYHVFIADRAGEPGDTLVTVAGKHCETDTLFRDVTLADPRSGDVLAVQSTGAYNYAMASNYNRFPRPAMVCVMDGQAELIVRRETYQDLLTHDVLPARLAL